MICSSSALRLDAWVPPPLLGVALAAISGLPTVPADMAAIQRAAIRAGMAEQWAACLRAIGAQGIRYDADDMVRRDTAGRPGRVATAGELAPSLPRELGDAAGDIVEGAGEGVAAAARAAQGPVAVLAILAAIVLLAS